MTISTFTIRWTWNGLSARACSPTETLSSSPGSLALRSIPPFRHRGRPPLGASTPPNPWETVSGSKKLRFRAWRRSSTYRLFSGSGFQVLGFESKTKFGKFPARVFQKGVSVQTRNPVNSPLEKTGIEGDFVNEEFRLPRAHHGR